MHHVFVWRRRAPCICFIYHLISVLSSKLLLLHFWFVQLYRWSLLYLLLIYLLCYDLKKKIYLLEDLL